MTILEQVFIFPFALIFLTNRAGKYHKQISLTLKHLMENFSVDEIVEDFSSDRSFSFLQTYLLGISRHVLKLVKGWTFWLSRFKAP